MKNGALVSLGPNFRHCTILVHHYGTPQFPIEDTKAFYLSDELIILLIQ